MKCTISHGAFPGTGQDRPHNHLIIGGDPSNPSWGEYLEDFEPELHPYLEAIKETIIRRELVGTRASDFCNFNYFRFDDVHDTKIAFSWRGFGDLMQAIVGKREGYMAYYM